MRHQFSLMLMLVGLLLITVACADIPSAHLLASQPMSFAPDALKATPTALPPPKTQATPAPSTRVPAGLIDALFYHGSESHKEVALTFDDGPDITYTPEILAILSQYNLRATFFNIGQHVLAYPQITKAVYAAGHTIGNHSWNHPQLTALGPAQVLWQMEYTNQIIQQTIGIRPTLMRPPYGAINHMAHIQIENAGLLPIMWNVDSEDWKLQGVSSIVQTTLRETRNGSIILMHDGGGNRTQTVAALPLIIQALEQRGYTIVPMQQLLDHYNDGANNTATPTVTPTVMPDVKAVGD
ncbi:polysaccharide deacetylase family protein [Dictyobacter kobayashii]|uniref:NodB homology domain-containing protein n=1 Tax=Dictyobacter kobayashii TaxID=2014872 RepID=A0A402AW44_9CHLR|nr:polysaccharide deacetylase family protein [Dictyobacter kobayashii]GCE23285.1 hypothetical protein KDK_70850 [Dictyobacter kobayashii]